MEQEIENNQSSNSDFQILISNENREIADVEDNSNEMVSINAVINQSEGNYIENENLPLIFNRNFGRRNAFRVNRHFRNDSRYFNPFIFRNENPPELESFGEGALNYFENNFEMEDDFENCSGILRSSKELYGSLSIYTIKKLLSFKLFNFNSTIDRIYNKVLEVYLNNLTIEKSESRSMFKQTKLFLSCLPSLRYIEKFTNKINFNSKKQQKNIFFLKLCLDIYEDYYKTFDFPLFKRYSNNFLNTSIKFYEKLTDENLKLINDQLDNNFQHLSILQFLINIFSNQIISI